MSSFEREISVSHDARLYRRVDKLEQDICSFIERGVTVGEPALILAPRERIDGLRAGLGPSSARVSFQEMEELGRNPARIIPALLEWIDRAEPPVRIACEPLWPGRSEEEVVEVLRHEALVETALEGSHAKLLCAFCEDQLPPCARASLVRSHQTICEDDGTVRERAGKPHSARDLLAARPLDPPGEPVEQIAVRDAGDLRRVRGCVGTSEAAAALSPSRRMDFVLAVNEAASNALEYGEPPHELRLWRRREEVIGEISGPGRIEDPLVGRRCPAPSSVRGRGLWLVNQLCDLVELRSSGSRTTLRMHKQCR